MIYAWTVILRIAGWNAAFALFYLGLGVYGYFLLFTVHGLPATQWLPLFAAASFFSFQANVELRSATQKLDAWRAALQQIFKRAA